MQNLNIIAIRGIIFQQIVLIISLIFVYDPQFKHNADIRFLC